MTLYTYRHYDSEARWTGYKMANILAGCHTWRGNAMQWVVYQATTARTKTRRGPWYA